MQHLRGVMIDPSNLAAMWKNIAASIYRCLAKHTGTEPNAIFCPMAFLVNFINPENFKSTRGYAQSDPMNLFWVHHRTLTRRQRQTLK
jgi:hypothetical protein